MWKTLYYKSTNTCLFFKHILILFFFNTVLASEGIDKGINLKNESLFLNKNSKEVIEINRQLKIWDDVENDFNLRKLPFYKLSSRPTLKQKKNFISKKIIKHTENIINEKVEHAESGSLLNQVNVMEASIKENSVVEFSKMFSLKFNVRILQGKAFVFFKNPFFDEFKFQTSINQESYFILNENIDFLSMKSGAEYRFQNKMFMTFFEKELYENISARISSSRSKTNSDNKFEMFATFPFNL